MKFTVASFVAFTSPLESVMRGMYLDDRGLVTCAMGDLIDPISDAQVIHWRVGSPLGPMNGPLATAGEIDAEWTRVKQSGLSGSGGGHQQQFARLYLDDATIESVYKSRLALNEAELAKLYGAAWDDIDWRAQMTNHSLAWAMGVGRIASEFVHFQAALRVSPPNYTEAANQSRMAGDSVDESLRRRNNAGLTLLVMAAQPECVELTDDALTALAEGTMPGMHKWQADGTWQ